MWTGGNIGDSFPATEDWDNEEWSGSLSDTKVYVFTPSSSAQNQSNDTENITPQINSTEEWEAGGPATNGPDSHIPTYTYHNAHHHHSLIDQISTANNVTAAAAAAAAGTVPATGSVPAGTEPAPAETYHNAHHQVHQPMGMSGSLSAAQSQYLSQLTQQSQRHENNTYGGFVYGEAGRKQRARLPPPSKVPLIYCHTVM